MCVCVCCKRFDIFCVARSPFDCLLRFWSTPASCRSDNDFHAWDNKRQATPLFKAALLPGVPKGFAISGTTQRPFEYGWLPRCLLWLCWPRKGYCAQCWCHHSKVCRWPDFHDEWPTETYQDEYAPTSNGDSGNARPMCSFYWRGCCKFGDTCWYSHPKKVCRSRVGRRAALARGSHRGFGYQRPCTGGESAQRWLSRPFWFGQRQGVAQKMLLRISEASGFGPGEPAQNADLPAAE